MLPLVEINTGGIGMDPVDPVEPARIPAGAEPAADAGKSAGIGDIVAPQPKVLHISAIMQKLFELGSWRLAP